MHVYTAGTYYGGDFQKSFFCLVCRLACYTLSRKKVNYTEKLEIIILIWECRIMIVQRIDPAGFLIDTFELKISIKCVEVMTTYHTPGAKEA